MMPNRRRGPPYAGFARTVQPQAPAPAPALQPEPELQPDYWIELPPTLAPYVRLGLLNTADTGRCLLLRVVQDLGDPEGHAEVFGPLREMRDLGQLIVGICDYHSA